VATMMSTFFSASVCGRMRTPPMRQAVASS
jgi:hypothetical protein